MPFSAGLARSRAYYRRRFADLWLASRIRAVYEPVAVTATCMWLTYGAPGQYTNFSAPAFIVFNVLLGVSFLASVAQLALGLAWGGVYRELPGWLPWPVAQKLEMFAVLMHGALLTHWSRIIGRYLATPVFAMLYEVAAGGQWCVGGKGLKKQCRSSLCSAR